MSFIVRRLVFYVVAAWVALTINFFIPRLVPGNAVEAIMSKFPNLQPSAYRALEALLGEALPWTIILVGSATVIAFLVGTALGIAAGWRHGGGLDRVLPGLIFLQAIPYFFFALILLELFAVTVHVFPIGQGYGQGLIPGWHWDFISSAVYHSLLPALTIVLTSIGGWMLQMRNVMISTIGEDYVVAAQAKGLPNHRVGLLLVNAVTSNDYPLAQGIFLVITFAVLLANLIVDLIIVFVDPRARAREATR
jgi:peptide/nickel transport system permease protein